MMEHRHGRKYVLVLITVVVFLVLLFVIIFISRMMRDNRTDSGETQESKPPAGESEQMPKADDPVSRAYFVYMVGYRSENMRTDVPPDLSADDPVWDRLMHTPLRLRDGKLCPDEIITYSEAAVYLYDSIGGKSGSGVPGFLADDPALGLAYEHRIIEMDERMKLV